jgi:mono/diheme cytochrome c family protein
MSNTSAFVDPDQRLINLEWRRNQGESDAKSNGETDDAKQADYDDQLTFVAETLFDELDLWSRRNPTAIPSAPSWLSPSDEEHLSRVAQGRVLFAGKANCAMCHGLAGLGDGQTENFDDWTNQWVKGAKIDPRDPLACAPFIDAGAFPPRPIRPRNLRLRVYRGGDRFADLYRRIANGIEGTGMPDASALSEQEIWMLVAYVLHLPYESDADVRAISPQGSPSQAAGLSEIPIEHADRP